MMNDPAPHAAPYAAIDGASSPSFSMDGNALFYLRGANDRDPAHFDVLVQDVATGERIRLHQGTHELPLGARHKDGERLIAIEDRSTADQRPFVLGLAGSVQAVAAFLDAQLSS